MDKFCPLERSKIMSLIPSKGTKPELFLRKKLHAAGFRYRVNASDLPGKPDLKLTKHKVVIFVNGCFWHGHSCKKGRLPKTNVVFWKTKIHKNILHDKKIIENLQFLGWRVCIVWECTLNKYKKDPQNLITKIEVWIQGKSLFIEL